METTSKLITEEVESIDRHNEEITTSKPVKEPTKEPVKETTKQKRVKPRKIEELMEASTRTMSDKEKDILIKYLKEEFTLSKNQITQLQNNIEQAYKKVNYTEDSAQKMESYFTERLGYISDAAKTFYRSILLATKGDIK